LPLAAVQTLVFVWLVVSCQVNVYVVRGRGRVWSSRPGTWLIAATLADVAIVSLLAVRGWLMAPIPPALIALVIALGLAYVAGAGVFSLLLPRGQESGETT
jgi:H+-transporting ATPase